MEQVKCKNFVDNVYYCCKAKGVKIGEIEGKAEVSSGYLSRLKGDKNPKPNADVIVAASDVLGVPVEVLLNYRLDELTPSERYIVDLLAKLVKDTVDDKLFWEKESKGYLAANNNKLEHPLFDKRTAHYDSKITYNCYESRFPKPTYEYEDEQGVEEVEEDIDIFDDCFKLQMPKGYMLYLMRTCYGPFEDGDALGGTGYEVYMVAEGDINNPEEVIPLCDGRDFSKENLFGKQLKQLYTVVVEACGHVKLRNDVKAALDVFMSGKPEKVDLNDIQF